MEYYAVDRQDGCAWYVYQVTQFGIDKNSELLPWLIRNGYWFETRAEAEEKCQKLNADRAYGIRQMMNRSFSLSR